MHRLPLLVILLISCLAPLALGKVQQAAIDLRCDGHVDPIAAGSNPRLTWRIESDERGVQLRSVQVLVSRSEASLDRDQGELWDSGKRPADRSPGITYAGEPLTAGDRCYWKVRWWDETDRASGWSETAAWEVAPLEPADWHGARWIDDGSTPPTREEDFYQDDPAPLLRRDFVLEKPVVRARLHLAGLGLCLPSLNGETIGDQVFDPPWTDFEKRILFRTHDLTDQLDVGTHCLGLSLGNGWHNPLPLRMWGRRNIRGSLPVGRPRVIACLIVEHPDGSTTRIVTDPQWRTAPGPTLRNSLYLGEHRDARREIPGWDLAGFDAAAWKPARQVDAPLEPLQPLAMPPARLRDPIPAERITQPTEGVFIIDFGRNLTGVPELVLRDTRPGTRITLRYGELLHDDGSLNPLTSVCGQIKGLRKLADGTRVPAGGPGAPEVAWQEDVYLTRGDASEVFRPRFTFHGFRYMEISGLSREPDLRQFRAFLLCTDLADAGSFFSSDHELNRIQEMCRRTFLANVVTVQSDCPHRERFAYGGDIVATSEAFLMSFDMAGFYAKTVRDWADAVRPDGRLTDTAPFVGIDYCGVGWAMVHPLLLEQLHRHYGDRRLLEEQLPVAMRWLDVVAGSREAGLVTRGLGDHEALVPARGPELLTPMFIDSARRIARLARVLGRTQEAARFEAIAEESAQAWAEAFLDPQSGKVGPGTQSAQTFALGFGAAPADARQAVFDHLVDGLMQPDDAPRLSTGIYGTRILLDELSRHGRSDLAHALVARENFPSWKWMLRNGATTLWEHWAESDNTFSHNHPMFGSVSSWFFQWLGGIQCAPDAVGFDRILLQPQIVEGLEWVRSSHRSIRGEIRSEWQVVEGAHHFTIEIPPTATALVSLPLPSGHLLTEDGENLDTRPGIEVLERGDSTWCMKLGSGRYRFESRAASR